MPSLPSRSLLPAVRPLLVMSKVVSFFLFVFLLCAGWVGVSYLKNQGTNRRSLMMPTPVSAQSQNPSSNSLSRLAATAESTPQPSTRLVYSFSTDKLYYHAFKHLQGNRGRTAMSEEAAAARGLKPCSQCFSK